MDAHKDAQEKISQTLIAALLVKPLDPGLTPDELERVVAEHGISAGVFAEVIDEELSRREQRSGGSVSVNMMDLTMLIVAGDDYYPPEIFPFSTFASLHAAFDQLDRELGIQAAKPLSALLAKCPSETQKGVDLALGTLIVLRQVNRVGAGFARVKHYMNHFDRPGSPSKNRWVPSIKGLIPSIEIAFARRPGQATPAGLVSAEGEAMSDRIRPEMPSRVGTRSARVTTSPPQAAPAAQKRSTNPWDDRWDVVRELSRGGHGTTRVVRDRKSGDATECVLKVLNRPTDPERRGRLGREVHALRKLDIEGVPRLIDANEDAGDDERLYLVTAFVPGATLEERVKSGALDLDAALDLVQALLRIVEQIHSAGVVHRDIKPDNIILLEGNHRLPNLVDFGLAVADGQDMMTSTEQQVGNRFLALPELHTPHDAKRDSRSDLTYCCGILFYAITGSQPMTLRDGEAKPPHRRSHAIAALRGLDAARLLALTRFFDVGFAPSVSARFQDASAVRAALTSVRSSTQESETKPLAVQSLWTIHAVKGEPTALYFHHRLPESAGGVADHFKGNLSDIPIDALPNVVQHAIRVLWDEVVERPEVVQHLPHGAPFKHAFDHINHVLDPQWASGNQPVTVIMWDREIQLPTELRSGPRASISISDLTPAGRTALETLDSAARRSGEETLRKAAHAMEEWNNQE